MGDKYVISCRLDPNFHSEAGLLLIRVGSIQALFIDQRSILVSGQVNELAIDPADWAKVERLFRSTVTELL